MDVLVDILLSLLGRSGDALPFGPLREACEALFRAFAEQVTSQGFGDLVRVVQLAPEGQADEGEDHGLFEEEDEDMLAGWLCFCCHQLLSLTDILLIITATSVLGSQQYHSVCSCTNTCAQRASEKVVVQSS